MSAIDATRRLTVEEALLELLAAIDATGPHEVIQTVQVGRYRKADTSKGEPDTYYWSLATIHDRASADHLMSRKVPEHVERMKALAVREAMTAGGAR